jgi:hypothetical protein
MICENIKLHPFNEISNEFIYEFAKKIISKKSVGIDRIEGKAFEKFICEIFKTKWKGSNDGLIDAEIQNVGFSVKSLLFNFPLAKKDGNHKVFRVCIGRCSPIFFNDSYIGKNNTSPKEAAKIILSIWNERLLKAKNKCKEFRSITILKSEDLEHWCIFETKPSIYNVDSFSWNWSTRKNKGKLTTNLEGINGEIKLTWQPHGSQFSLTQPVPKNNRVFTIKNHQIISETAILKSVGFNSNWIKIS